MNAAAKNSVTVENVSKKFSISMKRAMTYGILDLLRVGLIPHKYRSENYESRSNDLNREIGVGVTQDPVLREPLAPLRTSEFWALQNISFQLKQGECLGVIGHNGAGKSTLFSLISGIYGPTHGRITIQGRLQALIALGAGFHPILSGRENIYINAAVLGMKGREIDALLDDIIEFSEIGDFIDTPVKRYSSGMLVRLGFAVAVNLKPDVLLVDEVLAVGDLAFQNKSFDRMMGLVNSGVPVLFVSHSMRAIETICSKVIWLEHGQIRESGETAPVIGRYIEAMDVIHPESLRDGETSQSSLYPIRIHRAELLDKAGETREIFGCREDITIRLHYTASSQVGAPRFHVWLSRPGRENKVFGGCDMQLDGIQWDIQQGEGWVDCHIESPDILPGPYEVRCGISRQATSTTGQKHYQELFAAARFRVGTGNPLPELPGLKPSMVERLPPLVFKHTWRRK